MLCFWSIKSISRIRFHALFTRNVLNHRIRCILLAVLYLSTTINSGWLSFCWQSNFTVLFTCLVCPFHSVYCFGQIYLCLYMYFLFFNSSLNIWRIRLNILQREWCSGYNQSITGPYYKHKRDIGFTILVGHVVSFQSCCCLF